MKIEAKIFRTAIPVPVEELERVYILGAQDGADMLAIFAAACTADRFAEKNAIMLVCIEWVRDDVEFFCGLAHIPVAEFEVLFRNLFFDFRLSLDGAHDLAIDAMTARFCFREVCKRFFS
jgi:hypothetical protein